jgi:hypothetical protein
MVERRAGRRPRPLGGVSDFADLRQLSLLAAAGTAVTLALGQEADVRRLRYAKHWPIGTIARNSASLQTR